jgi:hypothetical protein
MGKWELGVRNECGNGGNGELILHIEKRGFEPRDAPLSEMHLDL